VKTFLLITALLLSSLSHAQTVLPEVVVTASRTTQTTGDPLASTTVISREAIEDSQALTLPQLLRGVAGIDVVSSGGLGKATSVLMRGSESDHVLVLVDGVKLGSATLGVVSWQHLPLNQIERIEIVRGPRSSLYGSEAIGGVIQIFTRKTQRPVDVSVGAGSEQSYQLNAGVGGTHAAHEYSLSVNHLQTQGFNDCQGQLTAGCFTIEPDEDGYDNTSLSAHWGYQINEDINLKTQAFRAQGRTEYDSSFDNEADFVQQVVNMQSDFMVNDDWLMLLNLGHHQDELTNFGHQVAETFFDTQRSSLAWQNEYGLTATQLFTAGYDYQHESIDSSTVYTVDSRDNHGIYWAYQGQWPQQTELTLSVRHDDNEQFGSYTTGHLGIGYGLTKTIQAVAAYGNAFKAPTFNELYFPALGDFPAFGNPQLQPEESKTFEVGLRSAQQTLNWSVYLYHTQIEQMIGSFPAENIDEAEIIGSEAQLTWQQPQWLLNTQLTWLNPEDERTGHLLPRRAQRTWALNLTRYWDKTQVTLNVLAQSHRFEDSANLYRLGGYAVLNLLGEYQLTPRWRVQTRLDNLFDKAYQTARFYNTGGRQFWVTLHYQGL